MRNREPNFEILRTMIMFFIVVWHFIVHGLGIAHQPPTSINPSSALSIFNFLTIQYITYCTAVGVNCFVLISGYFLVNTTFKWDKIIKIWIQVVFYSFVICAFLKALNLTEIHRNDIMAIVFPIQKQTYWFMTQYVAFLLLAPFLGRLAKHLSPKEFLIGLLLLILLNCSFIDTPLFEFPYGNIYSNGYGLLWFITLFFIGAYIRLYNPFSAHKNYFGWIFLIYSLILLLGNLFFKQYVLYLLKNRSFMYSMPINNGFVLFSSIFLFLWAKHSQFPNNKVTQTIVRIAPYTLGVYLIHDHPYIRQLLWQKWTSFCTYIDSIYLLPLMVVTSVAIFITCILIDLIRTRIFTYLHIDTIANKLYIRIASYSQCALNYILTKYNNIGGG